MAKKRKKPKWWGAFDKLSRELATVPKDKVDKKIARDKAKRIKAKKRKKK